MRLTALYTLERLANDNGHHQQTIVNIICAYLRMPYTPPATPGPRKNTAKRAHRHASRYRAARAGQPAPAELSGGQRKRMSIARALACHLYEKDEAPPPDPEH